MKKTIRAFTPGGGFTFQFGGGMTSDEANKITNDCSKSTGRNTVGTLFHFIQRNPQNLDEATIMAACLVKKKVVPKGYGASDYRRDSEAMSYPFSAPHDGDDALRDCDSDPLGLLGASK